MMKIKFPWLVSEKRFVREFIGSGKPSWAFALVLRYRNEWGLGFFATP